MKQCKCLKLDIWVPCSTLDLDTCDFRLFKQGSTITFTTSQSLRQRSDWMKLGELRIVLINALAANINSYFPEGSMSMFDVFLPFNLPTTLTEVNSYCAKLNPIALRFEANKENVLQQCIRFLTSNINYNYIEYCALKNEKNPAVMWPMMLATQHAKENNDFVKLVDVVLALPVGTADVERGFSILNHIRYDRRARFTVEHLEDMSRIRINEPSLSKFNAEAYALHWLKSGHMQSDELLTKRRISSSNLPIESALFNS